MIVGDAIPPERRMWDHVLVASSQPKVLQTKVLRTGVSQPMVLRTAASQTAISQPTEG